MVDLEQRLAEHAGLIVSAFGLLFMIGVALDVRWGRRWAAQGFPRWPQADVIRNRPWHFSDLIAVLTLLVGVGLAIRVSVPWISRHSGTHSTLVLLAIQAFGLHGLVLAWTAFLLWQRRLTVPAAFGSRSARLIPDAATGVLSYLALLPLFLPLLLVNAGLMKLFGIDPALQDIALEMAGADSLAVKVFLAVWAVLVAPVAEEILFRGLLLPLLLRVVRPVGAILIVSLLFAVIHLHVPALLPIFGLSIALCCAYLWTGSLVVSVAMHALFNALTTALLLLASA